MIYLDTHVIVWLYQKELSLFSKRAKEIIDHESLIISPAVVLELQYLYQMGSITEQAQKIVDYCMLQIGLTQCKLPFSDVIRGALDESWSKDPFDRIITAQARINSAPLLTQNRSIQHYYHKAVW